MVKNGMFGRNICIWKKPGNTKTGFNCGVPDRPCKQGNQPVYWQLAPHMQGGYEPIVALSKDQLPWG